MSVHASIRDVLLLYYLSITFLEEQEQQHCNSVQGWWHSLQRTKTVSSKYFCPSIVKKAGRSNIIIVLPSLFSGMLFLSEFKKKTNNKILW